MRPIRLSILSATLSLTGALVYFAGQFKNQATGEESIGSILMVLGLLLGIVAVFARDD